MECKRLLSVHEHRMAQQRLVSSMPSCTAADEDDLARYIMAIDAACSSGPEPSAINHTSRGSQTTGIVAEKHHSYSPVISNNDGIMGVMSQESLATMSGNHLNQDGDVSDTEPLVMCIRVPSH